jgi:hypothetical protein
MGQAAPDLEYLRHRLADRIDDHPVREWSAPLLIAVIGLLDAQALAIEMALDTSQPGLRLVGIASAEPTTELLKEGVVRESGQRLDDFHGAADVGVFKVAGGN